MLNRYTITAEVDDASASGPLNWANGDASVRTVTINLINSAAIERARAELAIVRLPFDVPSDPLVAARSETFESPFYEYQVPEAILRFRQGFGRLIRTQSDRGVVAVFDRRVLSKQYGTLFIDSLPQCTLRRGKLADLPKAAAQWLGA